MGILGKLRRFLRGDRAAAIVLMALMIGYGYESLQLSKALSSDVIGPTLYPLLLATAGFGFTVILLLRPEESSTEDDGETLLGRLENLLPWVMLIVYVGALPWIGFPLATFVFVASILKLLRQPSWLGAALLSLCVVATAHIVFFILLDIPLPLGPFGEAY